MQQLNLQLYGRTDQTNFNEQLSTRKSVSLTPDPVTVDLSLVAPEGEKFIELRLDPDDKPSSILLSHLNIRSDAGVLLYSWDGDPGSFGDLAGIALARENDKVVLESRTNDSFLLLPLAKPHRGVVVEVGVASTLAGIDQKNLADAIRSLQSGLRFALDDLAEEQEGLHEALLLHQANVRNEDQAIRHQLSEVLGQTSALDNTVVKTAIRTRDEILGQTAALDNTVVRSAIRTRDDILAEVRDDWRSLRQQITEATQAAAQRAEMTEASITSNVQVELSKLMKTLDRFRSAREALDQIRHELHVLHDEDAVEKVRQLKAEAAAANARIVEMENSLAWRLTRPFRISSGAGGR